MTTPATFADALWRKSTRSSPSGDNCVEVAFDGAAVGVRDSKNRAGGMLLFTTDSWRAFLDGAKQGEFDRPVA
jgi:hypothetical protein